MRSPGPLGKFSSSIETFFGGKISSYTNLCERTREEAFKALVKHAEALGAHAIIGMRYDANELAPGVTEVLAYGTAVCREILNFVLFLSSGRLCDLPLLFCDILKYNKHSRF